MLTFVAPSPPFFFLAPSYSNISLLPRWLIRTVDFLAGFPESCQDPAPELVLAFDREAAEPRDAPPLSDAPALMGACVLIQ